MPGMKRDCGGAAAILGMNFGIFFTLLKQSVKSTTENDIEFYYGWSTPNFSDSNKYNILREVSKVY